MLEQFNKMKWEEIYSYWKTSTKDSFCIVNRPPLVRKISINSDSSQRFYAHFWLNDDQMIVAEEELNRSVKIPTHFQSGSLTDERVNRSADLMVQSMSEEERAAIWIWIFCSSLEDAKLPYPNGLYLGYVGAKARIFLQESFEEWVLKQHHRFPYLYIDEEKLSKVKFERYSVIIDFAIMNAYMICRDYSIALFDSETELNEPPFSYRNLRKE